jgi:hypothetical protein
MTTYTLVTVAHQADYPLLRLQARSLNSYLRIGAADEICVVANQGLDGATSRLGALLADYGVLADRVSFLNAEEVGPIPWETTTGWVSQQILKLMVARVVATDRYVVLDAKNHLVFPLSFDFFEVGNKLRSSRINYENHPFRHFLERSLRYFNVDEHHALTSCLPTITPFVFETSSVRALVDAVCDREQDTFPKSFDRIKSTEFLLFAAYLCSQPGGIERIYDLSCLECPVIWRETVMRGPGLVDSTLARIEHERLPFFTVHRDAFPLLDEKSRKTVATLWFRRRLFDSVEGGVRFLADSADTMRRTWHPYL